jgi:hypothetical protein
MNNIARDSEIKQAQEQRMTRDTLILQKVNKAHREAFKTRFPGQVEHCMRLTAERLQSILSKKPADFADPATWISTCAEINDLSQALYYLSAVSKEFPVKAEDESNTNNDTF